jgi:hypothetical protein
MGYERNDRRVDRDYRGYDRGYGQDSYGRDAYNRDRDGDRGFFDRAGDEVRSWFGDEEAERRRRQDEVYDDRYERSRYASNEAGGYRSPDRYPNWARTNRDEGYGYGRSTRLGASNYAGGRYDRSQEGRQFEDVGYSRDAHGYGSGYDADYRSYYGDRSRQGARSSGGDRGGYAATYGQDRAQGDDHTDYRTWRDRQVSALDRDYDEYRRENRARFESEFASWRANRQVQRDSLDQVKEHQEVVGSDGAHVGKVDHVRSDHILLTKSDRDAGGHHHAIPSSWVATVGDKVTLNRTADDAKRHWRDTEQRSGLFGSDRETTDVSGAGRHNLDRSFSGTY